MKRNSAILVLSALVVAGITLMSVSTVAHAQGTTSFLSNYVFASGCTEDSSFCIQIDMHDDDYGPEYTYSDGWVQAWWDGFSGGFTWCGASTSPCANWISVSPVGASGSFIAQGGWENCPVGELFTVKCTDVPGKSISRRGTSNDRLQLLSGSYNGHSQYLEVNSSQCTIEAFGFVLTIVPAEGSIFPQQGAYQTRTGHTTP